MIHCSNNVFMVFEQKAVSNLDFNDLSLAYLAEHRQSSPKTAWDCSNTYTYTTSNEMLNINQKVAQFHGKFTVNCTYLYYMKDETNIINNHFSSSA